MIQMQRSLSLPGPSHSSPPVSPTITQLTTRSPTPSPLEDLRIPPRLHRYGSRSPQRPPSSKKESSVEPGRKRRDTREASPSPAPRSYVLAPTDSKEVVPVATSPSKLPQPLLQDVSQYVNHHLSAVTSPPATTTLEELAHLVRLSTYQERKRSHSRVRLQRSLVSTALSARLARCGELAHRILVENFRTDERKNFANLYNAIHDVRNSCDALRRYALLEPDLEKGPAHKEVEDVRPVSSFLHEIPERSRESLLNFLTQIRTNPDYLASRVANLSPAEFSTLTIFHQNLEPINSVLPFHNNRSNATANRSSAHIPSAVERLLSFQRHDPLSALIYTCFANSAGPDSGEDIRRTDIWATTCARLIQDSKHGTDPFICCVLNAWTALRDWSGRSNMEWFLMKILEDGAFLLEKAEDQAGTLIHVEPRNAKDAIAAEEFYEAAVQGLFEIVDDPSAGGIPEGMIELGNAILRKISPKMHIPTRRFLVSKWLFSVFLLNVIIHPESYGMMSEYHITEYGRQKILKEVALRSQKIVIDMLWNQAPSTPLAIKPHIENIMARFRTSRPSKSKPKLLPARSITSLRETVEVHPYLVLSPSDLLTMVNALFPERRPSSSFSKELHLSGLRSGASSISGLSTFGPRGGVDTDTASVISNDAESVISDVTTSREPLLDQHTGTSQFSQSNPRLGHYEDDAYDLRAAVYELSQALGPEGVSGSCHPCAEHWAVLFISPDGQTLSSQMVHDPDNEFEDEDNTSSSDDEGENHGVRPDLDKDYHQLRDSILKLVEDYEIPQTLDPRNESNIFSNRATALDGSKKVRSRPGSSQQGQSNNPYCPRDPSLPKPETPRTRKDSEVLKQPVMEPPSALISMLEAAESQCTAQSDFVNAHLYWNTLNQLHQVNSPSLKRDGYASLLNIFSRGPRDSIRRSASAIEEYDAWLVWLKQSQERHDVTTSDMMKRLRALRDKMWYVTDVRNSAAYEGARNVAVALKCMASPPKKPTYMPQSGFRPRHMSKSSTSNHFFLKTETMIMDVIAASEEHGGSNKLSDEQSEKTVKWLSQFGIENFCKGEERIHRFCLEIETCINKLVAENLMDGPVLWSSELFQRDKRILDSGRQKGDLYLNSFGMLSISDDGNDADRRRGLRSTDFSRPSHRDLRSMSNRNASQQSFDSGRYTMSRVSGDPMDQQDVFGLSSPLPAIDSTNTFWSPFQAQARAQSPTASIAGARPGTASSTSETWLMREERANVAKQRFLSDLKQILTSLLVSDLGTLVFSRGSETDSWFSGEMGQDCLDKKARIERRAKKKQKKRVIEKKKSFRDLRGASDLPMERRLSERSDAYQAEKGAMPVKRSSHEFGGSEHAESSSTNDTVGSGRRRNAIKDPETPDFPYKKAFKQLLRMFSVHPNPYAKLNVLYELEQLIIAYLTPSAQPKRPRIQHEILSVPPHTPEVHHASTYPAYDTPSPQPRARNLSEAISACKERRSHTLPLSSPTSPTRRDSTSRTPPTNPASTDKIVSVLQELFRDASIRPKTLFRDLQFIASFVPPSILDKTLRGKAFWDAGLAALGLKQDVVRGLIEIADSVVVHYTQSRKTTSTSPETLQKGETPENTTTDREMLKYGMRDAAKMWQITAKEGDPAAERELAIFYLTHPELVERVLAPLSRPRETFKAAIMEMHGDLVSSRPGGDKRNSGDKGRGGSGDKGGNGEEEESQQRSDARTLCVAYHWMELSANGGDELARKYLRQREEFRNVP